jgi:formate dehydrogenase major subunit
MTGKAPVQDINEDATEMEVGTPKDWAAGVPGVTHSMGPAFKEMGVGRSMTLLTDMNQKDGFDCMSCAWPDPDHRKTFEFCENGAKAVTWEATPVTIPTSFWAENSITSLWDKSEYWLGMQGRLIEPLYKPKGKDNYEPISWDNAFGIIGDRL